LTGELYTLLHKQKIEYAMANTTRKKREKRPYSKKTLLTQDELWKAIVPLLWAPLIRFCMEDWEDKIDFTKKPIFLDKELKRLRLKAKSKNRAVDFLMRLHLKDGTSKTFLLHIEVQGYPDEQFGKRVYQYYYRIGDILDEPVETLVIMIDDDPIFRPNEYRQVFGQTEMTFKFRMFKLLDNPPAYHGKEDNPFSVVFETAWYALKQNKLKTDEDLMNLKFRLIKRLLENKIDTATIYAILEFINIYLPFADSKKELTFVEEIESFIDNDNDMEALTIRQLYERKIREDGEKLYQKEFKLRQKAEFKHKEAEKMRQEEAKMRQEEAKMRQEEAMLRQEAESGLVSLAFQLHSQGFSVEKIAEMMTKPVEFVQKLINSAKKVQNTEGVL
jgi:hypothetical protein